MTNDFESITDAQLDGITGAVNWQQAHQTGKEWGGRGAAIGMATGAYVAASRTDLPGTALLGAVGATAGLGVGYAAGVAKGVYSTWNE